MFEINQVAQKMALRRLSTGNCFIKWATKVIFLNFSVEATFVIESNI